MKALIVCGSANQSGVSASMASSAERRLRSLGYDAEVVHPAVMRIAHCTGCGGCSDGHCVIDDDMGRIMRKV
ncbi:MAG: flavodoxin family protein [Candidatus Methanomethylophilaceae archaeon]|nr:flavodoxin family protein [Candidatus Methanomethylophilaceae archaeon]MBR7005468.1 flavodoxin family protein [Candidatus Methanomethylophilaceae archaeon]